MTAVKLARQQDTIVTGKPRYDSKSKGLVENAHRLVQGLLRTWVASMEKRYQTTLTPSSPLVQWCVRHFCSSLTRYTVLEEGLTSDRKTARTRVRRRDRRAERHSSVPCKARTRSFPRDGRKDSGWARCCPQTSTSWETPAGRQLAQNDSRPENKKWSKAWFAQVVCTPSEPKLSLLCHVYLARGVLERFGPTVGWKACAGRGGLHTHECSTRLEECLTREGRARARANAQAQDEALVPDSDSLEESAGPRVAAEDAQATRMQSSAQAVAPRHRVLPSERSNQESLGTWELLTWMSREKAQK